MTPNRTILAAALAACSAAHAQYSSADKPVAPVPVTSMPTRIYVDTATIPFARRELGSNVEKGRQTCDTGAPSLGDDYEGTCQKHPPPFGTGSTTNNNSGTQRPAPYGTVLGGQSGGDWRTNCEISHYGFNDPIVYPAIGGAAHLHIFSGSTETSYDSDLTTFHLRGRSTCSGGILNRTGYWMPALLFHCHPDDPTGTCIKRGQPGSRDGEVQGIRGMQLYYKGEGVDNAPRRAQMQWFPIGHRMIAGNPNSTVEQSGMSFSCFNGSGQQVTPNLTHIPQASEVQAGQTCVSLRVFIPFPFCWDGQNLDGPGHNGHMSAQLNCPDPAFPVLMPNMSVIGHFRIKSNADLDHLRFSSDYPASTGYPAGSTIHADRVEGFSRNANALGLGAGTIFDILLNRVLRLGDDAHSDLIGDPNADGKFWTLTR